MYIDGGGNIGIGTTSPSGKLHVVGSSFPVARSSRSTSNTTGQYSSLDVKQITSTDMVDGFGSAITFSIEDSSATSHIAGSVGAVRCGADDTGDITFKTSDSGALSEVMRINSSGNVGIGTTNPGVKLDVVGTTASNLLSLRRPSDGSLGVHTIGTLLDSGNYHVSYRNNAGNRGHVWFTNDGSSVDERMRISGNGNVGIGTTSPTEKLELTGNDANIKITDSSPAVSALDSLGGLLFNTNDSTTTAGTVAYVKAVAEGGLELPIIKLH